MEMFDRMLLFSVIYIILMNKKNMKGKKLDRYGATQLILDQYGKPSLNFT